MHRWLRFLFLPFGSRWDALFCVRVSMRWEQFLWLLVCVPMKYTLLAHIFIKRVANTIFSFLFSYFACFLFLVCLWPEYNIHYLCLLCWASLSDYVQIVHNTIRWMWITFWYKNHGKYSFHFISKSVRCPMAYIRSILHMQFLRKSSTIGKIVKNNSRNGKKTHHPKQMHSWHKLCVYPLIAWNENRHYINTIFSGQILLSWTAQS